MDRFEYQGGRLMAEGAAVSELAERFGTPLYVYSQETLLTHYRRLRDAFAELEPLICYSLKCCANTHLARLLVREGSGVDVVSGGELFRALRAGADPAKIVYAGVGKTDGEIVEALDAKIGLLNVESISEMEQLAAVGVAMGTRVPTALRVNPDVDPKTHVYTTTGKKETKFGVDLEAAGDVLRRFAAHPGLHIRGIHLHIGSPVNDVAAYELSISRGIEFIAAMRAAGVVLDTIDIGGGFGAHYAGSEAPPAAEYARRIAPLLRGRGLKVILEPGRSIAANAGIVVARVLHTKSSGSRHFLIVDASMNELIRPALYGAYHFAWPVEAGARVPATRAAEQPFDGLVRTDIVGPVCESSDFLAKDRLLPEMKRGDLLAVFSAGAYAMSMASQYNSRPRAAEVLVNGRRVRLIRRRETYDDLVLAEPPDA
ncbi:Diaminopimelate decarboxylase [Phycisphaerae bacterium RAS1]|nr:Diaminopimelate decarboxylase [Phycisphaerae bacterium RAS1]